MLLWMCVVVFVTQIENALCNNILTAEIFADLILCSGFHCSNLHSLLGATCGYSETDPQKLEILLLKGNIM